MEEPDGARGRQQGPNLTLGGAIGEISVSGLIGVSVRCSVLGLTVYLPVCNCFRFLVLRDGSHLRW